MLPPGQVIVVNENWFSLTYLFNKYYYYNCTELLPCKWLMGYLHYQAWPPGYLLGCRTADVTSFLWLAIILLSVFSLAVFSWIQWMLRLNVFLVLASLRMTLRSTYLVILVGDLCGCPFKLFLFAIYYFSQMNANNPSFFRVLCLSLEPERKVLHRMQYSHQTVF